MMEQQNTERLSIEAIRAYIDADAEECARRKRMYEYYRGRHRIRDRTMDDPTKPNNRLENGYPALISNAYTGYVFGEPISYTGEEGLLERAGGKQRAGHGLFHLRRGRGDPVHGRG